MKRDKIILKEDNKGLLITLILTVRIGIVIFDNSVRRTTIRKVKVIEDLFENFQIVFGISALSTKGNGVPD